MDLIEYGGSLYPKFQTEGNASQFAIPFAKYFCEGKGYDIGCNRLEWALPGAIPIDLTFKNGYDALNLPEGEVDYLYSSHCLEHLSSWVDALDYWTKIIKKGGILFLYLPDYSQKYWRPYHNRKHKHVLTPEIIKDYMQDKYKNIFYSGVDLNNSFMVVGEKK